MIRSMTGFGRAAGTIGNRLAISVTIRSVNHRYLEANIRLPEYLWELEPAARAIVSRSIQRGKVDVSIRAQRIGETEYAVRINRQIAKAVVPEVRQLLTELGGDPAVGFGDLLRVPDVITAEPIEGELDESEREEFAAALQQALDAVGEMRVTEGQALRSDIEERLTTIERLRGELVTRREEVTREALESYRMRVDELARTAGITIDADRLAQETVLLVDKADIAEELTRLAIHTDAAWNVIRGTEPAGKKLDFLSQEMLREINTLGQKSRSAVFRTLSVELKTEVERIREQVQNVE